MMTDWLDAVAERQPRYMLEDGTPAGGINLTVAERDRLVAIVRGVQRARTPEAIRDEIKSRGICTECWTEGHFGPRGCQCWNDE